MAWKRTRKGHNTQERVASVPAFWERAEHRTWLGFSFTEASICTHGHPASGHHPGRHVAAEAWCVGTKTSLCFSCDEASTWAQWHTARAQHPDRHGAPEAWCSTSCPAVASLLAGTKSPRSRCDVTQCPNHPERSVLRWCLQRIVESKIRRAALCWIASNVQVRA